MENSKGNQKECHPKPLEKQQKTSKNTKKYLKKCSPAAGLCFYFDLIQMAQNLNIGVEMTLAPPLSISKLAKATPWADWDVSSSTVRLPLFDHVIIGLPLCRFIENSDAANSRFDISCVDPGSLEAHLDQAIRMGLDLSPTSRDQGWIDRALEFMAENAGEARFHVSDADGMYRLEDCALSPPVLIAHSIHVSHFQLCDSSGLPTGLLDLVRLTGPWWLAATRSDVNGCYSLTFDLMLSALKANVPWNHSRLSLVGAAVARWITDSAWEKELSTLELKNSTVSIERELSQRVQCYGAADQRQRVFIQRVDTFLSHFPNLEESLSGQGKAVAYREHERLCISKKLEPCIVPTAKSLDSEDGTLPLPSDP